VVVVYRYGHSLPILSTITNVKAGRSDVARFDITLTGVFQTKYTDHDEIYYSWLARESGSTC
jgi:hypothetical protein